MARAVGRGLVERQPAGDLGAEQGDEDQRRGRQGDEGADDAADEGVGVGRFDEVVGHDGGLDPDDRGHEKRQPGGGGGPSAQGETGEGQGDQGEPGLGQGTEVVARCTHGQASR